VFICDLGQNFAGWARLKVRGPAGTRVQMRYGELLNKDGTLNPMTSVTGQIKNSRVNADAGGPLTAVQTDTYTLRGGGEEVYTPRFTFHGFRYVELTGYPGEPAADAIQGLRLNSDVEPVGEFSCSNPLFNRI
jgi:alpha-L-rhamnosidase